MSLISAAETAASPYLIWIKLGAIVLAVVGLLGAGAYGGYRWEHEALLKLQLADAKYVAD